MAKNELNEKGQDFETSEIEAPRGRGRPRKNGTSTTTTGKTILAEKLNLLTSLIANVLGYEYIYNVNDYKKEADALSTISKSHSIVARILEVLDPIIFIGGMFDKFHKMPKKAKSNTKEQTDTTIKTPSPSLRDRLFALRNNTKENKAK